MSVVFRGGCSQGGRPPPPQAVVKPNILTHLIEGFVIHEGAEPFPVSVQNWFDTIYWSTTFVLLILCDWQICGSVKDSAGDDLTNDSADNNQSETAKGNGQFYFLHLLQNNSDWKF